jgi:hypothetical protein
MTFENFAQHKRRGERSTVARAIAGMTLLVGVFSSLNAAALFDPALERTLHQNSPGIVNTVEAGDRFGSSLATGDFDGNGERDLAIGVPGEGIGGVAEVGGVHVVYWDFERTTPLII